MLLQTHINQDPTNVHSHQLNTILYQLYNQVNEIVTENQNSKDNANNLLK